MHKKPLNDSHENNKFESGDVFVAPQTDCRPGIMYIATQPDMYHAKLSFLNRGLRNLAKYCIKHDIKTVSLPKIGAGLGKLDWNSEVKPAIEMYLNDLKTVYYVYEDFKNDYESNANVI